MYFYVTLFITAVIIALLIYHLIKVMFMKETHQKVNKILVDMQQIDRLMRKLSMLKTDSSHDSTIFLRYFIDILSKLETLQMTQDEATLKLNTIIETQINTAAKLNEAQAELSNKLVELQSTIDSLNAAAGGGQPLPQAMSDALSAVEAHATDLLAQAQALADIIPNTPV